MFTAERNPLFNTSSLSNAHCRVVQPSNLEEIVKISVERLGENEEKMRFVYSKSNSVIDIFREIDIKFEPRAFGVIPVTKKKGGYELLKMIQPNINNIFTSHKIINFCKVNDQFDVLVDNLGNLTDFHCDYLVLASGGYSGKFQYTDCFKYKEYNIFDLIMKNGGSIINTSCLFIHPFGYNKGRKILTGKEIEQGEFVDYSGEFVFDSEFREIIKRNNYHERFGDLNNYILKFKKSGRKIYFINPISRERIEVVQTVHYTAGGIKTDIYGEVDGIKNLYAIGECQADGSRNCGRLPWLSIHFIYCIWEISC